MVTSSTGNSFGINLSNAEKFVYRQHAIKDGSARNVIEGLAHSGDSYDEAGGCLKAHFDRPRLNHCTHVQMIVDTPPLKEGNGKELRRLHDTILQHARALKTLGCELPDTLFEWRKHSQTSPDIPHYQELLDFIDLLAQASETSCTACKKQPRFDQHLQKPPSRVASFATNTNPADNNCVVCKTETPSVRLSQIQITVSRRQSPLHKLFSQWTFQATMQVNAQVQGLSETAPHSSTCRDTKHHFA